MLRAQSATTSPTTAPQIIESKPGPWGHLQLVPIVLELPENVTTVERATARLDRWHFAGMVRIVAEALLVTCGFTESQMADMRSASWSVDGLSCAVDVPDRVLLSLAPACRAALYAKLMVDPANKGVIDPSWYRVGKVDARLRGSGLSDASMTLLKSLLYPGDDDTLLFNEIRPALRAIADPAEQTRFLKAVTRHRAIVGRLQIDENTDTASLANYWGRGGREANLLPLLDSYRYNAIAGVERPGKVNVAMLLPPFVQQRLYHYAEGASADDSPRDDCYWSTLNFFNDVPDDRMHDLGYIAGVLQRDYDRIDAPSQLGDVILIADGNGNAMHAVNYIADDLVFTKNGVNTFQPWILAPLRDVTTVYRIKNDKLTFGYFRKKSFAKPQETLSAIGR